MPRKATQNGNGKIRRWPRKQVLLSSLNPAPYNPRQRTKEEQRSLRFSIHRFGIVEDIVWNKRTGNIVGGHARYEVLKKAKEKYADVIEVDFPIEEEQLLNMVLNNPHSQGHFTDAAEILIDEIRENLGVNVIRNSRLDILKNTLKERLDGVQSIVDNAKEGLKREIQGDDTELDTGDGGETVHFEGDDTFFELTQNVTFTSTNKWGIPDLDPDALCKSFPTDIYINPDESAKGKLMIHGSFRWPENAKGGYLGFYADDFRFEQVWYNAKAFLERLLMTDWKGVLTPDFSVGGSNPMIHQLWQIYRARWVSRYWQEAGLSVIPSMQWTADKVTWTILGLPTTIPVISVQCRTDHSAVTLKTFVKRIHQYKEMLDFKTLLIYGVAVKDKIQKKLPKGIKVIWIPTFMGHRTAARKGKGLKKKGKQTQIGYGPRNKNRVR